MINLNHSTNSELEGYSLGTLPPSEARRVGKHLLNCPVCRELMPMPSVERFLSVIMTDAETQDSSPQKEDKGFSVVSSLAQFSSFWRLQSGFLWGSALLILIFSLSFVFWSISKDSGQDVARTFETTGDSETVNHLPNLTEINEGKVWTPKINHGGEISTPEKVRQELPKQKIDRNISSQKKTETKPPQNKEKFSTVRGGAVKCQTEVNLGLEFATDKDSFVFKWKKVENATKYHLYISDDEEILIDEYETEAETTFILKKPLDPLKTYKWKIIVTLENGKKISGESRKFTVREFYKNRIAPEKKNEGDIRCSPKN